METAVELKSRNYAGAAVHVAVGAAVFVFVFFAFGQFNLAMAGIFAAAGAVALLTNPGLCASVLTVSLPFVTVCVVKSLTGKALGFGIQPVFILTGMLAVAIYLRSCVTGRPVTLPRGPVPLAIAGMFAVWVASIITPLLAPPYGFGAQHIGKYVNILLITGLCFATFYVYAVTLRGGRDVFRHFLLMAVVTDFAAAYGLFRLACYFNNGLRKLDFMRMFLDTNVSQTPIDAFMRLRSVSFEAGAFGDFLLLTLPALMCYVMEGRGISRRMRVFMIGSFVLTLAAFIMTGARGATAGLAVAVAVVAAMSLLGRRGAGVRFMNLAAVLVVFAGCLAGLLYYSGAPMDAVKDFAKNTISGRFEAGYISSDLSVQSRLSAYEKAAADFGESPVFGLGFTIGGFYSYPDMRFGKSRGIGGWQPERNLATFALGECGVFGFLAFVFFLVCVTRECVAAFINTRGDPVMHALAIGLSASIAGLLVSRVFAIGFGLSYFWFPIALLVVLRACTARGGSGAAAC